MGDMAWTDAGRAVICDLVDRGLHLQAYERAQRAGPLAQLTAPADLIQASRLVWPLGASRLSSALLYRAFRIAPQDPEAVYRHAMNLMRRRGIMAAWEFMRARPDLPQADTRTQAFWLALHGRVASAFRDFDAAEAWMTKAMSLGPDDSWLWIEQCGVLQAQDRLEEALAAARRGLELQPDYARAAYEVADILLTLQRDDEAQRLLVESASRAEYSPFWALLAGLQAEHGDYDGAAASLDRLAANSPLAEKGEAQWLAGRRSDLAYYRGDLAAAVTFGEQGGTAFWKTVVPRLREPAADTRRVRLRVPFVRQGHMTCGPATLTALSKFWNRAVEQPAVIEQICYAGTTNYDERRWARQNDFVAREFTVTWPAITALLDRGVPFSLATAEPSAGHLQAVVGYDAHRGTLDIREPSAYFLLEYLAQDLLDRNKSTGPRGLVILPSGEAHRLDGLELPDERLFDLSYDLEDALRRHDRTGAEAVFRAMEAAAPNHRLTCFAGGTLATYDHNPAARLEAVERLLQLFPGDEYLLSRKLCLLDGGTHRQERLAILDQVKDGAGRDPFFVVERGQWLRQDGRLNDVALRQLRRAFRSKTYNGPLLSVTASTLWAQDRREEAVDLYRFAQCVDDANESLARSAFIASRYIKQTGRTLAFLKGRFKRFGKQSSQPARLLFWAYDQLAMTPDAFEVLAKALRLRPDDGELLLFAADESARRGRFEEAESLLVRAAGHVRDAERLRTEGAIAGYRGENAKALEFARRILHAEPYATDAHREVARLLAETEDAAAAVAHLRQAVSQFPHNYALRQLLIEWLRGQQAEEQEAEVRRLLDINPVDAWAHRELALVLRRLRRFDEALAAADMGCRLEPGESCGHSIRAWVEMGAGKADAARESFRQAIRLSVDNDDAISGLIQSYDQPAQQREALQFVQQELVRQVIFGDGLLAYRGHAHGILDGEQLLKSLREALDARPDLWHAWSAVVLQLVDMGRIDEAETLSRQATERFPLVPRAWLDHAAVYHAKPDRAREIESLEKAVQINQTWAYAVRELALACQSAGQLSRARQILEQAVSASPSDPYHHGCLADVLWRLGEKTAAFDRLERACRLSPAYEWAWNQYPAWAKELQCPQKPVETARQLVQTRPGDAHAWFVLAKVLEGAAALDERLKHLDRAIELSPRLEAAHDLKATVLFEAGRTDDALAACRPPAWPDLAPPPLRWRGAWILSRTGRLEEAIRQLKALVADEPTDSAAREQLAILHHEAKQPKEFLEAAQETLRLRPTSPGSMALVADAMIANDRPDDAKEFFRKAIALAPAYAYGGSKLFDLLLGHRELDEAREVLGLLKTHAGGPYALAREVQLEARCVNKAAALAAFQAIAEDPAAGDDWPLDAAMRALKDRRWESDGARILLEVLEKPRFSPEAGRVWVRHSGILSSFWHPTRKVEGLLARGGDVGVFAAIELMESLAARRNKKRLLLRFIRRQKDALKRDPRTWGSAGYALAHTGDVYTAAAWLSDYAGRQGVQTWMLGNLVFSLRSIGRADEAYRAAVAALALPPDQGTLRMQVWAALRDAICGRYALAAGRLQKITEVSVTGCDKFAAHLAWAILAAAGRPGDANGRTMADHLKLALAAHRTYRSDRPAKRDYLATLRCLRKLRGGIAGLWLYLSWRWG